MVKRGLTLLLAGIGAVVVLLVIGLFTLFMLFGRTPSIPSDALLVLEVGGDLTENAPTDVVTYLQGGRTPTLRSIVDTLHKAKSDARVSAVLLKPTGFASPYWGKVQELRDAVLDFRTSGKPIYAFLEYADERTYYLATATDRIVLMPSAPLDLKGLATYALFLRGTFDKIGVVPDMHHIGAYKTAVNAYTEKTYTPAHKEMDESLNRDLFAQIVKGVAETRRKSETDVRTLIDDGPFLAAEAKSAGLVDELGYEDQAIDALKTQTKRSLSAVDASDYARVPGSSLGFRRGPRIAVIYASGAIVGGRGGYDPLNGETLGSTALVEAIRAASNDSAVKAIVLRIDSPGGSATASDAIWHELMRARAAKPERPLIVSMSDTRGIGRLLHRDAGTGDRGATVDAHRLDRHLRRQDGDRRRLRETGRAHRVDEYRPQRGDGIADAPVQRVGIEGARGAAAYSFYDEFVRKAAESRRMTPAQLEALAQGRVWTGQQAKANGLVDELGGLDGAGRDRQGTREDRRDDRRRARGLPAPQKLPGTVDGPFLRYDRSRHRQLDGHEPVERGALGASCSP
ncbi:MAG: S49 family peptidase [Vicinamibacterales bacterium]